MTLLSALSNRYAIKQFSDKKVAEDKIKSITEAARLAPSAFGLQPYRLIVITDRDVLGKLAGAAFNQKQLPTCSHLFVFAAETSITEATVDAYFARTYAQTDSEPGSLDGYADYIKGWVSSQPAEALAESAKHQAFISLGLLVGEASLQGVDSCPMTGFNPAGFDEILGLTEKGLTATVICAVGYREEGGETPQKVRLPADDFIIDGNKLA